MQDTYPSLIRRLTSSFLDLFILFLMYGLITYIINTNESADVSTRGIIFFGFVLLFEPLLISIAYTPGQFITGIRVVSEKDGKKINLLASVWRYFIKVVFGWLSFFACIFSDKKRAFHDIVSGSVVIDVRKKHEELLT